MSVVDLSYAVKGTDAPATRLLALSVKGWAIGWAVFEEEKPIAYGQLVAKDHHEGKPVPVFQRANAVLTNMFRILRQHGGQLVISHTPDAQGPLWMIPLVLATCSGLIYGDLPEYRKLVGDELPALKSWATVLAGKELEEIEILALGIGAAAAQQRISPPTTLNGLHEAPTTLQ